MTDIPGTTRMLLTPTSPQQPRMLIATGCAGRAELMIPSKDASTDLKGGGAFACLFARCTAVVEQDQRIASFVHESGEHHHRGQ